MEFKQGRVDKHSGQRLHTRRRNTRRTALQQLSFSVQEEIGIEVFVTSNLYGNRQEKVT